MPDTLPAWAAPASILLLCAFVAGMAYADRRAVRKQRAAEDARERHLLKLWGME